MTGKHLFITLRRLRKNLLYALLVIIGLSIGISTFLVTLQWAVWHFTFDRDFPENKQIFRLTFEESNDGFYRHTARVLHGPALHSIVQSEMLTGLEQIGRLAPFRKGAFILGENSFYDPYAYACDPQFLEIFRPEVLHGPSDSLLREPYTLILTESTAVKFFGIPDPVGRSFEVMHQFDTRPTTYTVAGVIRDFPANSHFRISILTAFEDPDEYDGTGWAYLKLEPSADPRQVEGAILRHLNDHIEDDYVDRIEVHLQHIGDIHLHSHKAREIQPNVRYRTVLILLVTGILVFLLAWFNFTLLAFSQNQLHIHRLVIQWQMGAGKRDIFQQVLLDTLVIGGIAMLAGLTATLLAEPLFSNWIGSTLFLNPRLLLISSLLLALLIILGSVATAFFSTSRLYRYLQQRFLTSRSARPPDSLGRNLFIRAVIVLQFMITFVLVSNLWVISRQTRYIMGLQLGSNRQEAIHLYGLHRPVVDDFKLFKERMLESPAVQYVTASLEEPTGQAMDANNFFIDGVDEGDKQLFLFPVDQDFLRFYDLKVIHGEDLPVSYNPEDSAEFFILNETAARMISDHPEALLGSELTLDFPYPGFIWPGPIIGIVEDFHLSGADYEVGPMVIFPNYTWLWCFSILPSADSKPVIEHLENVWKELFPQFPLEYHFSSSMIRELYRDERIQIRILGLFSILSVIISGMGLFALSGFFMQRRIKSAALKKIHGAGIRHILLPELGYYLWLALLSAALSAPASWLLIDRWLRNFKYRTDIPLWIFPCCVLLLVVFSWLAVIYHTWRLARINPVEFVREQ